MDNPTSDKTGTGNAAPHHRTPQPSPRCFACGPDHPHGLRLRFQKEPDGAVVAQWTPQPEFEGFQGIIHGGIIATVLDEAMSQAVAAAYQPALTCSLEVRLRQRVRPGEPLIVRGWVVERRRRRILVEAVLLDEQGKQRAHARAIFLEVVHHEQDGRAAG